MTIGSPVGIDPDLVRWSGEPSRDRTLLVLLHGRGSNEGDLFELAPFLPSEVVVASLRAPIREGPGYAWYPLHRESGARAQADEVQAAVAAVLEWLDGLPEVAAVGLLGFSQGGAISLQMLRAQPRRFSFVVQLSGFLLEGDRGHDADLEVGRPPVFWGRGLYDEVISSTRVETTATWLRGHATLQERTYETGHSVTRDELLDVSRFISDHLRGAQHAG